MGQSRTSTRRRTSGSLQGKAFFRFCACIGTMNRDEAAAGALASWIAAVLCRFCARGPDLEAPEDWRTPKPGGMAAGSGRGSAGFTTSTVLQRVKQVVQKQHIVAL